jgi:predicted RNA-binding Zn-ribbon protein involved in translation (DUF1610 family)
MTESLYTDYPVHEVLKNIERLAREGHQCYVKFTCESCGARQTAEDANTWHPAGYHCEECGHLTIPQMINFMFVSKSIKTTKEWDETWDTMAKAKKEQEQS